MSIVINPVSGELDAAIVDGNFEELETFLKENVKDEDFSGRFGKYKIRRYTSGKIVGFNSGSSPNSSAEMTGLSGTFENNWIAGTPAITYATGPTLDAGVGGQESGLINDKNDMDYNHPSLHPFELLGYPGGSMHYDFQEEGFADPVSYYNSVGGHSITKWPPESSAMGRFPKDECWSRWLTVPDAAGGVYVDEPCVAIITAQVKGNYFMTPALRVHGTNTTKIKYDTKVQFSEGGDLEPVRMYHDLWQSGTKVSDPGQIVEGMQNSAFIRMGLFVDTNPITWEDEFRNGDAYGNSAYGSGHGYNPWIGESPTGEYLATKPEGVSKARSWVKVSDITQKVRQRGSYKIIGVVQLKGRRKYNFSLKTRPAMTFGHVSYDTDKGEYQFYDGYWEIGPNPVLQLNDAPTGTRHNPAWKWGSNHSERGGTQTAMESYCYPGGDALVTNLIESSSISVEFFYGQSLSSVQAYAAELVSGVGTDLGV